VEFERIKQSNKNISYYVVWNWGLNFRLYNILVGLHTLENNTNRDFSGYTIFAFLMQDDRIQVNSGTDKAQFCKPIFYK
jgi:hypothetical protein